MNFSKDNINKPTPKIPGMIGNMLIMSALGLQPLIIGAPVDVLTDKGKFWASVVIVLIGVLGKGFTMMFAEENKIEGNEQNQG